MNYLKIQFKNGVICEYKTPFCNPNLNTLGELNSALFVDYKHLGGNVEKASNYEAYLKEYYNLNTLEFLGAKALEFKKIDGRTKQAKALNYYTHRFLFENYK